MQIHGDRPIQRRTEDRLGFAEIAERIARALIDRAFDRGLVVGIEGAWGSGKSSLLQLVRSELEYSDTRTRPAIVTFSPWLIGDRDALLRAFFDDLAKTVERFEPQPTAAAKPAEGLSDRIRQYAKRLDKAAPVISTLIGLVNSKAGELSETAFDTIRDATEGEQPLEELKEEIAAMLRDLPSRVIVFIDDLDRLEPAEIGEIVRLVRSVADFENVVYVLCYDQEILARSIEKALHVADGHAFLEKIIQISVPVPAPEPFALRRLLMDGLSAIRLDDEERDTATAALPGDEEGRLSELVDNNSDRLPTPRHVFRVMDAVAIRWAALRRKVDFADLAWLQIIRLSNRDLYHWIEEYAAKYVLIEHHHAVLPEHEQRQLFQTLTTILKAEGREFDTERFSLDAHLPGIQQIDPAVETSVGLFAPATIQDRNRAEADQRLASPNHHRLFFAWSKSSDVIDDSDVSEFLGTALAGVDDAAFRLQDLLTTPDAGMGTRGEQVLQRLEAYPFQDHDAQQCAVILEALASAMDYPIAPFEPRPIGGWNHWRIATRLVPKLKSVAGDMAPDALNRAFQDGAAIGWLTEVLRKETFAHGLYGDRPRDPADWVLTETELHDVIRILHNRYADMPLEIIRTTPEPSSILFAWHQSGGAEEARTLVGEVIKSHVGLLDLMECFVSVVQGKRERYDRLQIEGLGDFLNLDAAIAQLGSIKKDDPPLAPRAEALLQAYRNNSRR